LVDADGSLKICDFGLSRRYSIPIPQYTPTIQTGSYRSPEIFLHNGFYEPAVDIWSAGCVLAEITRGKPLFEADSDTDLIHKVFQAFGTPPADVMDQFVDVHAGQVTVPAYPRMPANELFMTDDRQLISLCERMLAIDPKRRITAKDALRHPYFDQVSRLIKDKCYPRG
jgi:serine/threonine protein kinase